MANNDFWANLPNWGPGLFQAGAGIYGAYSANKEGEERLQRTQGPLYNQTIQAAGDSLNLAGGFDPKVHAADRFGAQQELLAPDYDAQENALRNRLFRQGRGDTATFGAVGGVNGAPGVQPGASAVNPDLAAFYAAKNANKGRDAYNSLNEGEAYLDRQLNRSGTLQTQANNQQVSGQRQLDSNVPTKSPQYMSMITGGLNFAKESGLLGKAGDWLGEMFGGSSGSDLYGGGDSFDFGGDFSDFGSLDFGGVADPYAVDPNWWNNFF